MKKIKKRKEKVKVKNNFQKDLQLLNENMKVLWSNDQVLSNKIAQVQQQIQQPITPIKKISISDEGLTIESHEAFKDLNEILNNKKAKDFFSMAKNNSMLKHASYIE